jgi:hypothetical protein
MKLTTALFCALIACLSYERNVSAGTVSCSVELSWASSMLPHFSSHRYVDYYNFWGNLATKSVDIVHTIDPIAGYADTVLASNYSGTLTSDEPGVAGQCYRARLSCTTDDSSNEWGSSEKCTDPPPPPDDGGLCQFDCNYSPIVFDLGQGGYQLTGLDQPVDFDIDGNGRLNRMAWTAPATPMAFLAMDRNHNGLIDSGSELFGNHTPGIDGQVAPNGFEALKTYDSNADGFITSADPVWTQLLLWTDLNHNGVSEYDELVPISVSHITAIGLRYHADGRVDRNGNVFRYEGRLVVGRSQMPYYDIYFRAVQ